jgi:hypothetical protein
MKSTNQENEKKQSRPFDLEIEFSRIAAILKSQGNILRLFEEVEHGQMSSEAVAGLGDLLLELGERLDKAANAILTKARHANTE